jgi:hypothetical protein
MSTPAKREQMIDMVLGYFDACNSASRERFNRVLTPDCKHYFPPGTGGPYHGAEAIADLWINFVRQKGSQWTIERLVCDGAQLCIEWTHHKPLVGEYIRGSEWYEFADDGRICAIWAHYASPRDPNRPANELEGFNYSERGYPMSPPELDEPLASERAANLRREGGA